MRSNLASEENWWRESSRQESEWGRLRPGFCRPGGCKRTLSERRHRSARTSPQRSTRGSTRAFISARWHGCPSDSSSQESSRPSCGRGPRSASRLQVLVRQSTPSRALLSSVLQGASTLSSRSAAVTLSRPCMATARRFGFDSRTLDGWGPTVQSSPRCLWAPRPTKSTGFRMARRGGLRRAPRSSTGVSRWRSWRWPTAARWGTLGCWWAPFFCGPLDAAALGCI
eukprot:Amastigsp_a679635_16.p2 type:complete len:226 gc:universal Amastigsp_a679635_16:384-1061(+)